MKVIINESQRKMLFEFLSDIVYHFTDEDGIEYIFEKNVMPLTKSDKYYTNDVQNDASISENFSHYLSFTRVRNSNVGYGSWRFLNSLLTVRIQFNGNLLNCNFKGKPVDYFKTKSNTDDFRLVQSEDRLLSNKPFIGDIDKYIDRIDILLNDASDKSNAEWFDGFIKDLKNTAYYHLFSNKIMIYFNKEDFNLQK
jgi:hypothetical protein